MRSARVVGWLLWLAVACLAPAAHATTVLVMSIEQGRAQLLVNGTAVRTLREGQTSPEGVKLISADRTRAVLEVDGRELALGLGGSTVASAELKADRSGHFADHRLRERRGDAGADRHRRDLGHALERRGAAPVDPLRRRRRGSRSPPRAARAGYRVNLATVRVGGITLHNVDAMVMEGGKSELPITLIGMSFLNGVEMRHRRHADPDAPELLVFDTRATPPRAPQRQAASAASR